MPSILYFAKEGGRVISYAVRAVAFFHMFSMNAFELSSTSGDSMLPTLHVSDDYAIVDKRHKYGRNVHMGDVIVARKPNSPESWVCKRITGMPGDIILIDPSRNTLKGLRDQVAENTTKIEGQEELERSKLNANFNNYVIVPEGHCWVTGDNLTDSIDSRTYSVLPMGLICGKLIRAWYVPRILSFKDQYFRQMDNTYCEENW
ncbi:hypothetical protein HII13_003909 [Brettanomyces bruxellensis]|nr:hypothetical protein HII13_003909 [Brettanomyces bruxellensis]